MGVSLTIPFHLDTFSNSLQLHPFAAGHQWVSRPIRSGLLKQAICQKEGEQGMAHATGINQPHPIHIQASEKK